MSAATPNSFANQSTGQELVATAGATSASNIFWTDPSVALWAKACVVAGYSRGLPGCPSREVADFMYLTLGA